MVFHGGIADSLSQAATRNSRFGHPWLRQPVSRMCGGRDQAERDELLGRRGLALHQITLIRRRIRVIRQELQELEQFMAKSCKFITVLNWIMAFVVITVCIWLLNYLVLL